MRPESIAELARCAVDAARADGTGLSDVERLTLAWALKDACYTAWTSDPRRAAKAAHALQSLSASQPSSRAHDEIVAIAAWTQGIACVTEGRMADAVDSLDNAARAFRALDQHQHAAETQVPAIMALSMLGRNERAAECAIATQREFLAHGDVRSAAKVSLNLGSLHLRQEAHEQAALHYREAAVLFARVGDVEHSVMSDIGLADALTARGEFDEAMRIYARARMRAETHGFPVLAAIVDESVALVELVRGRYREALAGLERSRRRYESLAMPQHLAIAEKQLADVYLELRLLPEAGALFDHALREFEALEMPTERAWTLVQQGRTHALLGDGARAERSLGHAHDAFDEQHNEAGEAAVALARAELAISAGIAEQARTFADEAVRGFTAAGLADRAARAQTLAARAQLALGNLADARRLYGEALSTARQLQLLHVEVECLTGTGLIARSDGHINAATVAFEAAVQLFEDQRRALPGDELQSAFLADHLLPYRELLRIALDNDALSRDGRSAAAVLDRLERVRARSLMERLSKSSDQPDDDASRPLRERLHWLYRRVQRAQHEGDPTGPLLDAGRAIERELLERARRARLTAPAPPPGAPGHDGIDVAQLEIRLGKHDALVEYGVLDDELFACVVRSGDVRVERGLARWCDVQRAVEAVHFQVDTLRHGEALVAAHAETLLRRARVALSRLHGLLWAPLARDLSGCSRVLIVPHAELGAVPFAALYDGEQFVGAKHDVALAPSARIALYQLEREPKVPQRALAVGESTRLPHAGREALFVASMFERSDVFVDESATIDALRTHCGEADVVHLACHAQFRGDNPMFSALHLHDGAVTAEWVERLHMRPGFVVLSACETALSVHRHGDEMVGLVRAFMIAGSARVIATLWPIDDAVTARFMASFYPALQRLGSAAAAIGVAQRELMRYHPHPFYWAGFTVYGGW